MEAGDFDEIEFFRAIAHSGVRALLIGRRALVLLGLPVLTADYDFWIDIEHIASFNRAIESSAFVRLERPSRRGVAGRYALENDEHVDVLVARSVPTPDGAMVAFDALWETRRILSLTPDVTVAIPDIGGLIQADRGASKRSGGHPSPGGAAPGGRTVTPSASARLTAKLREESERTLSAAEVRAYLEALMSDRDRDDVLSLVRWFRPTLSQSRRSSRLRQTCVCTVATRSWTRVTHVWISVWKTIRPTTDADRGRW